MIKKCMYVVLACLYLFPKAYAQEQFNLGEMETVLLEEINKLRESRELKALASDETLNAVAFDQASYILKNNKLVHEQDVKKKETLLKRIEYYKGLNAQAGENLAIMTFGSKAETELGKPKEALKNPELLIKAAIVSWLKDDDSEINLLDPNFYQSGIAVLRNENNGFVFVFVGASLPYEVPVGEKISSNNEGIDEGGIEACKEFLEKHATLSELFSDAFIVENNEVFFEFNNLSFIEEILDGGGDGIAVEIIQNNQFNCNESNRLFPGEVADGFLMPPARKGKLNVLNPKKEIGEVKISLGKLPSFYSPQNCEINGLIIHDGLKCASVPFNKIETKNVRWLNQSYQLAGKELPMNTAIGDSSVLQVLVGNEQQITQSKRLIKNFLEGLSYKINAAQFSVTCSPMHEKLITSDYLDHHFEDIFGKYFNEDNSTSFQITADWPAWEKFKSGTYYQLETKDMDGFQVIEYLEKTTKTDTLLKNAVDKMNVLTLRFEGEITLRDDLPFEEELLLFKSLLKYNKIELAANVQRSLIKRAIKEGIKLDQLGFSNQSQKKETLDIINNQIVAQELIDKKMFDGNPIHKAFLELYLINPNNTMVRYNYHLAMLEYWSKSNSRVKDIDKWKKGFDLLNNPKLPKDLFAKTYINYWIIAADFHYENGQFDLRKKAFDNMVKLVPAANFTPKELLLLAQYLCHQDQFTRAIKLIKPAIKGEEVDEDLLLYFLQIAIYDQKEVNTSEYEKLMQLAQSKFPKGFCQLFTKQKMGIQGLKNENVKRLYCENCK